MSGIEDLYVFKEGLVYIDVNGSLGTTHTPAKLSLKSLHVQEAGTFELYSASPVNTFDIDATNISVSSSILVLIKHFYLTLIFCHFLRMYGTIVF